MIDSWESKKKFTCLNDCRSDGCPGHVLTLSMEDDPVFVSVTITGAQETKDEIYIFDVNQFKAMMDAYEDLTAGRADVIHR